MWDIRGLLVCQLQLIDNHVSRYSLKAKEEIGGNRENFWPLISLQSCPRLYANCICCIHYSTTEQELVVAHGGLGHHEDIWTDTYSICCCFRFLKLFWICRLEAVLPSNYWMSHISIISGTKGFMGEPAVSPTYCPINGVYSFTYSVNDGTENSLECNSHTSEIADCPYGFGFNLNFKDCSFGDMGM